MAEIIEMGGITKGDISVAKVIKAAEEELDVAVIIGIDKEGHLYFASSNSDKYEVLWLIEQAKKQLLSL